jgi:vancomycin resistance protein YoaR
MTRHHAAPALLEHEHEPSDLRARRDLGRRARRRRRIGGVVAVGAIAIILVGIVVSGGSGIPPKVSVGGVDIGGLSVQAARTRLTERGLTALDGRITLTAPGDPTFSMDVAAATLASQPRLDEAIAAARSTRGRFGRALARFGLAGRKDLPLRFVVRTNAVSRLITEAQLKIGRTPVSATVALKGTDIVTTPARAGRVIDLATLRTRLATLPASVELPVREARPPGDDDDATRARDVALRVIARSHEVTLGEHSALLVPAVARRGLRFPLRKDTIAVELDPEVLRAVMVKPLAVSERPPAEARLEIRGSRVAVIPSRLGRKLDARALSAAIVAAPDAPTVAATLTTSKPRFTTAEAKALGIREKISEFTTPYQCCQARVTNIQRAARILDGTILGAGERFSLNAAMGERTKARGFVIAPMIAAGELVDAVGGGVSQVATTTYNAAFFAGLELQAHTPHEFYISRYPMGREATVSWRTPDLVFRNDWSAAILMSYRAGSNGITVAFYSSKLGRRVETTTGQPTSRTKPKTIERKKPDLPPGTRNVVQPAGPGGFSVSYTRKVYRGNRLKRDETFHWTYRPENAIVEIGPPAPTTTKPVTPPTGTTTGPTTTGAKPTPTTTTPGSVPPPPAP